MKSPPPSIAFSLIEIETNPEASKLEIVFSSWKSSNQLSESFDTRYSESNHKPVAGSKSYGILTLKLKFPVNSSCVTSLAMEMLKVIDSESCWKAEVSLLGSNLWKTTGSPTLRSLMFSKTIFAGTSTLTSSESRKKPTSLISIPLIEPIVLETAETSAPTPCSKLYGAPKVWPEAKETDALGKLLQLPPFPIGTKARVNVELRYPRLFAPVLGSISSIS